MQQVAVDQLLTRVRRTVRDHLLRSDRGNRHEVVASLRSGPVGVLLSQRVLVLGVLLGLGALDLRGEGVRVLWDHVLALPGRHRGGGDGVKEVGGVVPGAGLLLDAVVFVGLEEGVVGYDVGLGEVAG